MTVSRDLVGDPAPDARRAMAQEEPPDLEADFLCFYRAEKGRLVAHLLYVGFPHHIADDAASDALTELYGRWFEVHTNPRMWVRTTARRIARKMTAKSPFELARRLLDNGFRPVDAHHDAGLEAVLEHNSDLVQAVMSLPARQRVVIALRLDGFTKKEIAAELDIAVRTVDDRLKKAGDVVLPLLAAGEEK